MQRAWLAASSAMAVLALAVGVAFKYGGGTTSAHAELDRHWPLLDRYCIDCHNDLDLAGELALEGLRPEDVPPHADVWEEVVRKVRSGLMPPPGRPQPDPEIRYAFVDSMERYLDEAAAEHSQGPARVPVRRLNRTEYANAIRDLIALEIDPAELLPQDDRRHGFDNIAEALQVSPAFVEQYVTAARLIADRALGRADAAPESRTYVSPRPGTPFGATTAGGGRAFHLEGMPLGTRGGMTVSHFFPADGEYVIDIHDMAGALWVYNMEFENTLMVIVAGKKVYETVIGGEEDLRAIDQEQDAAVEAINQRLKNIRFAAPAGQHDVAITFVRRTFAESDDRLHELRQGFARGVGQDRLLRVPAFDITGPFDPSGISPTASRERIFGCYPETPAEEAACAEDIVRTLTERAYRRPITAEDVEERMLYYREGRERGGFEEGVRMALAGLLASPHFLYRGEPVPDELPPGATAYRIDDLSLASRLSFFLWRSLPDDELRALAASGRLSEEGALARQVTRMLEDDRARTLAESFAYQWLHLDRLEEIAPDGTLFPSASGPNDQRRNFVREISLFVDSIFRENRSIVDLLTASHTYLNESLAWHYGINHVRGDHFRRVELEDSVRHGLLGKGAVLLASSYPNRTSPVLRGEYIMDNIMGAPPAAPPPEVEDNLDAASRGGQSLTVRERLAAHSEVPSCHSCHGVIDPLGFALENFDVDGTWRLIDKISGRPIDASGELPDGTQMDGPNELRAALTRHPEHFAQTFVERLLTYALGRPLTHHDMPAVRDIVRRSANDDFRFYSVVLALVTSDAFRMQALPETLRQGETAGQTMAALEAREGAERVLSGEGERAD